VDMVGPPTYEYDVGLIYTALIQAFADTHKSLDIICFAQIFRRTNGDGGLGLDLPSWVPDWSVRVDLFVIPLLVSQSGKSTVGNFRPIRHRHLMATPSSYDASRAAEPSIGVSGDKRRLTCKGLMVCRVDGLGALERVEAKFDSLAMPAFSQSRAPVNALTASTLDEDGRGKLLDAVVRTLTVDRGDRYLSRPAPRASFCQDLQYLVASTSKQEEKPSAARRFDPWFQHNKDLLIKGITLEELCTPKWTPEELDSVAREGADESETGFLSRLHDTKGSKRMGLRLITTTNGNVCMAPPRARSGDVICVLFGCSVPVVLRRFEDPVETEEYEFIGGCYLVGFMNGEALDGGDPARDFVLR